MFSLSLFHKNVHPCDLLLKGTVLHTHPVNKYVVIYAVQIGKNRKQLPGSCAHLQCWPAGWRVCLNMTLTSWLSPFTAPVTALASSRFLSLQTAFLFMQLNAHQCQKHVYKQGLAATILTLRRYQQFLNEARRCPCIFTNPAPGAATERSWRPYLFCFFFFLHENLILQCVRRLSSINNAQTSFPTSAEHHISLKY